MIKDYPAAQLQNILIAGHGHVGKTTLTESLLAAGGSISQPGQVDKGTTVSDFDEEEISRKVSLHTSIAFVEYADHKLNFLDAPGSPDFIGDVLASLHVADSALVLVDAEVGPEIESLKHSRQAEAFEVPRALFLNKMDKERANFETTMELCTQKFSKPKIPIWIPIGAGENFQGVVDLLKMKALLFPKDSARYTEAPIPESMQAQAQAAREALIEAAAEGDDKLTEEFLEGQTLSPDEIDRGLNEDMMAGRFIPVFCGCANRVSCAAALLDVFIEFMPNAAEKTPWAGASPDDPATGLTRSPGAGQPFSALVFKTMIDQYAGKFSFLKIISGVLTPDMDVLNSTINHKEKFSHLFAVQGKKTAEVARAGAGDIVVVTKIDTAQTGHTFTDPAQAVVFPGLKLPQSVYAVAVNAVKKGEDQKMSTALAKLCEEDPTLTYRFEPELHQSLLEAMGDLQIDIALARLKKKYNLDVERTVPRVLYKETIQKPAQGHHKHKKQSGGHGQYGEVYLDLEPLTSGVGYQFEDRTHGGSIPKGFMPGIEKGVKEAMQRGVLAGYPVIDVAVRVTDGSFHEVDSSEMSFKIAGRKAFYDAMEKAGPVLLEPVMQVAIAADDSTMGAITSDVNSRRGRILSMGTDKIEAQIPQAELLKYAMELKAMTSGTATFEMNFSHYQPIQGRIAEQVIKEAAALHGQRSEED